MYARCSHCNTVFKINAAQLQAAEGVVRCGMCHQPFNALETLQETLEDAPEKEHKKPSESFIKSSNLIEKTIKKSWFSGKLNTSLSDEEKPSKKTDKKQKEMKSHVFTVVGGIDHIWEDSPEGSDSYVKPEEESSKDSGPQAQNTSSSNANSSSNTDISSNGDTSKENPKNKPHNKKKLAEQLIADLETPIPEVIEIEATPVESGFISNIEIEQKASLASNEDKISSKHVKQIVTWAICLLLAISFLGVQTVYYLRNTLSKHSEIRPAIELMCSITGCKLPPRHSPESIRIISRELKIHPNKNNALIVDATLWNTADYAVQYPVIEIKFYGYSGSIIGRRQFLPKEYLVNNSMLEKPMPSEEYININLEIISPGEETESFMIRFL